MDNATQASYSNVPLFPICYYVSAFSTFLISKNLMTINERNQSVFVINALFEYLGKSENESLAKSQLLAEVLTKTNINQEEWNGTLDMKYVNQTLQYIITASILHHCDNITGYLSGHANRKERITHLSFRNIMHNESEANDFLFDNSEENADRSVLEISEIDTGGKKRLNSEENLHVPTKIQRIDTGSSSSAIEEDLIDNDLNFDNISSKKSSYSFYIRYINSERKKQACKKSLKIEDDGKSKRMLAIEAAADIICSCVPICDLSAIVDTLRGFLLKLENSTTLAPTYNHLAQNVWHTGNIPSSYNEWKIPKDALYLDVLFKSYFGDIDVTELGTYAEWRFLSQHPINLFKNDLKVYQNSIKLQKSLRLIDLVFLRFQFLHSPMLRARKILRTIKLITDTLYKLALRECEEDWIDKNITLYAIDIDTNLQDLRANSSARRNYTFVKNVEFSANLSKEKNKLEKYVTVRNVVLYTLELENQAGIVNIDRFFENGTSGRFIVPINTTFAVKQAKRIGIDKYKVFSIEMRDERLKEKKMKDMVENLVK